MQLAVDKDSAAGFFAAHAQLVRRNNAVNHGFHGARFFLGKEQPALSLELFRWVIGEGRPAGGALEGDGIGGAGDASGNAQRRPGQYLASCDTGQGFGSFFHHRFQTEYQDKA